MIVVLSAYAHRRDENRASWGEHVIFDPGLVGVREAHLVLARWAVSSRFDETFHVIQDDVTDTTRGTHRGEVTSYYPSTMRQTGRVRFADHICPRSFTATAEGWRRLVAAWDQEGKTCELWPVDYIDPKIPHDLDQPI